MMPEDERSDLGPRLLGFRVEDLGFVGLADNLGLFCFFALQTQLLARVMRQSDLLWPAKELRGSHGRLVSICNMPSAICKTRGVKLSWS